MTLRTLFPKKRLNWIQFTRETRAVDGLSLAIRRGEFVSIVGRSGAGKTTLLSMIGGLTRPSAGKVYIDSVDIWKLGDAEISRLRNEKIGFIFQFASLISTLTVLENLLLPSIFSREKKGNLRQKAEELLSLVGLAGKINSLPAQLSSGEQRRVAIARALMNDPKIILADEPTGDLDEKTEEDMIELFQKINLELGTTFVLVTHSTALARHSRRILTMTEGRIIKEEKAR